ncbi:pseudouridine-5'-phosphate glycosidase [Isobaculum melis]|uniref:Pseudouridine-5'-phosphate glycosidase n=1 Tax=Isobaculum melis TaxID=142588 RepID=A0A1H9U989_9LACT|nr:pseudouridine-5'-phosphate glycosidase [Isobaculum melis]SES05821.1 pseudouridine-5'-phosphate glycosidase [Isobaculum melis]
MKQFLELTQEVQDAVAAGKAVVALESTIISHGMPYPQNVETALEVERVIREGGATPATIAIMDGKLKVGLSAEEIDRLGKEENVAKVSRRDIPFVLAKKVTGATTVATTMIIAEMAGIQIFATGGIGGVHRGAETTMDISADLEELAQTNVAVICAGAKSILDIKLTLEYLETKGVPVVGVRTEEFPSFFTRRSGFGVDYTIQEEKELALALKTKWDLNLKGGAVVANPVPEAYEMDDAVITKAIQDAVKEAAEKGIAGKEVTPFLLAKVKEITGGDSLETNIQLVFSNARVATKLAVELAKLT